MQCVVLPMIVAAAAVNVVLPTAVPAKVVVVTVNVVLPMIVAAAVVNVVLPTAVAAASSFQNLSNQIIFKIFGLLLINNNLIKAKYFHFGSVFQ